jgi:2-keto-4-pentenoate hydratase
VTVGVPSATPREFADPLAAALWQARASQEPVPRASWPGVDLPRARDVAAELYAKLEAMGVRRVGAKAAATDAGTQAFLGADEPLVAPIFGDVLMADGATVSLSDLMSPVLEAEIGMRLSAEGVVTVPCIEIPQSRFSGGDPHIAYIAADFAGQGGMVFGPPGTADEEASVIVTVDGAEVRRAGRSVADARAIFALVQSQLELRLGDYVATGTFFPPIPLSAGEWVVDFGEFGRLTLHVR